MPKYHQGLFKPKNPKKYIGDVNQICYRSGWELQCMLQLDSSPDVIAWASEPAAIPYYDPTSKRTRRYFPDFVVKIRQRDGKVVTFMIEVKPAKETVPPVQTKKNKRRFIKEALTYGKNVSKWKAAQNYCQSQGWIFRVMTEKELGIQF